MVIPEHFLMHLLPLHIIHHLLMLLLPNLLVNECHQLLAAVEAAVPDAGITKQEEMTEQEMTEQEQQKLILLQQQ